MMPSRSRDITLCAVLTAVGLILGYIETFIVIPLNIPGIRIGLANISTLITLYLCGPIYAVSVHLLRIFVSSVLFGSTASLIYSICGGMVAFIGMAVLKRFDFSIYGVSAGGAVLHNIGQTAVASVIIGNIYVFSYLPVLAITGCVFGLATGAVSNILISRLKHIINFESEGSI